MPARELMTPPPPFVSVSPVRWGFMEWCSQPIRALILLILIRQTGKFILFTKEKASGVKHRILNALQRKVPGALRASVIIQRAEQMIKNLGSTAWHYHVTQSMEIYLRVPPAQMHRRKRI